MLAGKLGSTAIFKFFVRYPSGKGKSLTNSKCKVFVCCSKFSSFLEINECKKNPCRNGSFCIPIRGGFHCSCLPGFTGHVCDIGNYLNQSSSRSEPFVFQCWVCILGNRIPLLQSKKVYYMLKVLVN